MGLEIELKAHIDNPDYIRQQIEKLDNAKLISSVDKTDIYWAHSSEDKPLFRTRLQLEDNSSLVYITSKPGKNKKNGTEINIENEFRVDSSQWDSVIKFVEGLDLVHCRHKYKKGWQFMIEEDGFNIHAELMDVKYLGWFLEMEICCNAEDELDIFKADRALRKILRELNVSEDSIESRGYNKLLEECGKILG